jgi:hypothetical protein
MVTEKLDIEQPTRRRSLDEVKDHAMELREFEDPDWEGTREDSELLWNIREALPRSVEKGELEVPLQSEPVTESELDQSSELSIRGAELLLAELDANPLETGAGQKGEKVENAERSL